RKAATAVTVDGIVQAIANPRVDRVVNGSHEAVVQQRNTEPCAQSGTVAVPANPA
ncbi:MAG: hypothetical protein ACJARS_002111, partial [bacterium]